MGYKTYKVEDTTGDVNTFTVNDKYSLEEYDHWYDKVFKGVEKKKIDDGARVKIKSLTKDPADEYESMTIYCN